MSGPGRPILALLAALAACGDGDDDAPPQTMFGGDRPVELRVPADHDPATPAPLLLVLHGYSINGATEVAYTRLDRVVDHYGALVLAPDGTVDPDGALFWNTAQAGCEIGGDGPLPDDLGYLVGLLDEVGAVWSVDPRQVYVFGHSNGGFMAHALACRHADRFAAIVSLAGAPALDAGDCAPSEPVTVLQLHGDADGTVSYTGGDQIVGVACPYPGAVETVARWAGHDACAGALDDSGDRLDLDGSLDGDETRVERYAGCPASGDVELWTMAGGAHIPVFRNNVYQPLWEFLAAHPKP